MVVGGKGEVMAGEGGGRGKGEVVVMGRVWW